MRNFGDSFGFRRLTDDFMSGAEGGFKVLTGASLLQGDLVEIDPAHPGYLVKSASGAVLVPGFRGILVQRDEMLDPKLNRLPVVNTRDLSQIVPERHAIIMTGAGIKVWYKNLAADTRTGYRNYAAETRLDLTGIVVGSTVGWDGSKYVATRAASQGVTAIPAIGTVTLVESDGSGFEFTLNA